MPQEVALLLPITRSSVGALYIHSVHQVTSLPPFTRLHVPVPLLMVDKSVLQHWVSGAHEIVQDAASFHDSPHSLWVMLHGGEKYLEPVSQDAEGVFHQPSCPGQPLVEDPLFTGEVS